MFSWKMTTTCLIGVAVFAPENQLPAEPALVCGAAFAPVIVVPTARPALKTVAAATAA
jgi:hypothetical protein